MSANARVQQLTEEVRFCARKRCDALEVRCNTASKVPAVVKAYTDLASGRIKDPELRERLICYSMNDQAQQITQKRPSKNSNPGRLGLPHLQ